MRRLLVLRIKILPLRIISRGEIMGFPKSTVQVNCEHVEGL